MVVRFGILVGVSTDPQAHEDKASIPDQIQVCRQVIREFNGEEVGCYKMDGYSRTGYDSLADAMNEIPDLKAAIDAAAQDQYDVLILDNWDRLGDLGQLVSTRFKKYRKQIYSARQSGRLQDPATYDPYSDESADIDMHLQGILQKYRINKLRRGWSIGMPRRIDNGLNPLRIPFAYTWVSKKDPPRLEPARGLLVQQLKDLLFAGRSYKAMALFADRSGCAPPNGGGRWDPSTIRNMLSNPFYAGIIVFHRTKYIHDPNRKRKTRPIKQPHSRWKVGKGKHQALWDEETHLAILKEIERRREANIHSAARFPLSGLLRCSVCGRKLHRHEHGHPEYGMRRKVFSCGVAPSHVIIPYQECLDLVSHELVRQLEMHQVGQTEMANDVDHNEASMEELRRQRKRIQEGHKLGIYSDAEAQEEVAKIYAKMEEIEQRAQERQSAALLRAEFAAQIGNNLQRLPTWIQTDDPQIVNRILSALCDKIVVTPDRTVEFHWRA